MPMERVKDVLLNERSDQKDVYLSLRPPAARIAIHDSLAPLPERYRMIAHVEGSDIGLRFTPTSLRQLCGIASIPVPLLDRAPSAVGLNLMRSMLEMSEAGEGRPFLFRLRLSYRPKLRAILPQSFVRLADLQVAEALQMSIQGKNARVASLHVDEDTWFTRFLVGDEINLGSGAAPDPVAPGIDLITSETGIHPMEIRHVLLRIVCANGITRAADRQSAWQSRYTAIDRPVLEKRLAAALDGAFGRGREIAGQLSDSRAEYVNDPRHEIRKVFQDYRLGNPAGRIGEWIGAEVMKSSTLFGISRWTICQAFTAVARGLDHPQRMRFEDAMGSYLMKEGDTGKRMAN